MSDWTPERLIAFTDRVKQAFLDKRIAAPVHLCGGNEWELIHQFKNIKPTDWVFSTWRSTYHALLHGIPEEWIFDEILAGRSMYLMNQQHRFISSSIVGGILPIACGVAMGIKRKRDAYLASPTHREGIEWGYVTPPSSPMTPEAYKWWCDHNCGPHLEKVWVFVGDMTARIGLFHEFCEYSGAQGLPVKVVIEDNGLSTDTPTTKVWGDSAEHHYPVVDREYSYERQYPHVGCGKHVQF